MEKEEKIKVLRKLRLQVQQWKEHPETISKKQEVAIDDKIMFLKGYSNAGEGNISTYEGRIIDHRRRDCKKVMQILEQTKSSIVERVKDFTIHCDKFLEYLELRLELAGKESVDFEKDPRFQKYTKSELEEFDQIIKRKNADAYIIDIVSQYIHCIYLEQVYEQDDYDNGGVYIQTLTDARKALYDYRSNNSNSIAELPPEILNMMIALKLKYGFKEECFTPSNIFKFLNGSLIETKKTISIIKQIYRIIGEKSLQARDFQISSETSTEQIELLLSHPLIKSLPDLNDMLNAILKDKKRIIFKNKFEEKISTYNNVIESVIGQYLTALVNELKKLSLYAPSIIKNISFQKLDAKNLEELAKSVNLFLIDVKRIAGVVEKGPRFKEDATSTELIDPLRKRFIKSSTPNMSFYRFPVKDQYKIVPYKGKDPDRPMYEIIPFSNYNFASINPDLLPHDLSEYIKMVGTYFFKSCFKDVIMNKNIQDIIDEIITLEAQKEKESTGLSL